MLLLLLAPAASSFGVHSWCVVKHTEGPVQVQRRDRRQQCSTGATAVTAKAVGALESGWGSGPRQATQQAHLQAAMSVKNMS